MANQIVAGSLREIRIMVHGNDLPAPELLQALGTHEGRTAATELDDPCRPVVLNQAGEQQRKIRRYRPTPHERQGLTGRQQPLELDERRILATLLNSMKQPLLRQRLDLSQGSALATREPPNLQQKYDDRVQAGRTMNPVNRYSIV